MGTYYLPKYCFSYKRNLTPKLKKNNNIYLERIEYILTHTMQCYFKIWDKTVVDLA